ncbi:MAG: type II secretion system protein M [Pseudomonadota bacterium]
MKTRWLAYRKRYWDSRSLRERRILLGAAWIIAPIAAYWLLWQPAHTAVAKLNTSLPVMRAQAEQLRVQAAEVAALRHRPRPAQLELSALRGAVEASAARHQIREAITAMEVQPPHTVRITLVSVSFEQWIRWLRDLQQEQHIRAESVSVAALPQNGMVRISAALTDSAEQP